jgi:hypothetical protein
MKTRINNKEQEINVSPATQEPLSEEIIHKVNTWTNPNGKTQTQHTYEVLGQIITSNMEISDYELENIKRTLKTII